MSWERLTPAQDGPRPRFSIVTAVYNVEAYLAEFIASVEGQKIGRGELEVIAVDDGSTDGSLAVLRDWAGRSRHRVHVFTKPNGGQGSARNLGLEHVTGEWVTFPDPDDILDPGYLRTAERFAARHGDIEVMSARPVLLHERTGRLDLGHPRRWQYDRGDRIADLVAEPSVFLALSPGSFFRRDRIDARTLRFDDRIRPNFEDAHFVVRYLLDLARPRIGLLHDAIYIYRKRASGESTLQSSWRHPGKYTDVLEHGYLDAIRRARAAHGSVPPWLQQLLVYELSWYVSTDEAIASPIAIPPELEPRFHALFDEVLRSLDPEVVMAHRSRGLRPGWADILARASRDEPWHSQFVVRTRVDRAMGLQRLAYRFVGERPSELVTIDGAAVQPAFEKTMVHRYLGRDMLSERLLWIPLAGRVQVQLDEQDVPMLRAWPRIPRGHRRLPWRDRLWHMRRRQGNWLWRAIMRRLRRQRRRLARPLVRALARSWLFHRYRGAWLVMDRVDNADDNGERLFEHLQRERKDVNAWFAIARGTPDAERLRRAGTKRLIDWGSFRWRMALMNAAWLVSSHADRAIVDPARIVRDAGSRSWKFAFLQHGVIKDDLSRWLNHRAIDLFVVSTEDELASVAGDGTGYVVTHKETRNTGLPRFDRLLAKGRGVPPAERDLVIVAPTWRTWLSGPIDRATNTRGIEAAFWESDYARSWIGLLRSERVAGALARRGWRLGFMPHPNFQPILRELDLPAHVEPLAFAGTDVQGLYARTGLLVTDYSSVAFNIAYLDRPLVYFQFDRDDMLRGAHMGRQGYFDYERDGFGPVVLDLEAAEAAVVAAIEHGPSPTGDYQARIDRTFPVRDGRACERVVAAIEELSRPWRPAETQTPGDAGPAQAQDRDSVGP